MTTMFDKYDKNIAEPKPEYRRKRKKDRLVGSPNVKLLKNIKGYEIGISAKEGSAFDIYFTFDGEYKDGPLSDLLRLGIFTFKIYDKKHHEVYSAPVIIYPEKCIAQVTVISEVNENLKYGNYYMRLEMYLDGITYTLFAENDGVLSVD